MSERPLRVLLHGKFLDDWFYHQVPGNGDTWGNCQFIINGPAGNYDRVVVYDTLGGPLNVTCPPDGTLFIASEPPEVKIFNKDFLAQFHRVLTSDSNTPHPGVVDGQPAPPWFVGIKGKDLEVPVATMSYEDMRDAVIPDKTDTICAIASFRNSTHGHKARVPLIEALQRRLGDKVIVVGRHAKPFSEIWEVLAPCKYHLVLENSRYNHYFTNKICDAYLADCFPFFWGPPDAADYFPEDSYREINIHDPEGAAEVIARGMAEGLYEKTREARAEAKRRVLEEYNMFPVLARLMAEPTTQAPAPIRIRPEPEFQGSAFRKFRRRLKRAVPRALRPKKWKV